MIRRLARFGAVGITATITHYLCALVLTLVVDVYWANVLGYAMGTGVSYYGHHRLTFAAPRDLTSHRRAISRFLVSTLIGVAFSQAILYVAVSHLLLPPAWALAVVVTTLPVLSFLLLRFWVFEPSDGNMRFPVASGITSKRSAPSRHDVP